MDLAPDRRACRWSDLLRRASRLADLTVSRRGGEFAHRAGSATVLNAHPPRRGCSSPPWRAYADVAQLVEHHLAKVRVAGSNPVVRSEAPDAVSRGRWSARLPGIQHGLPARGFAHGGVAEWLRQGPAKPCTRVRFPSPPRGRLAQWESASLTPKRSLVQSQYRPPVSAGQRPVPRSGNRPQDHLPPICHQDAPRSGGMN